MRKQRRVNSDFYDALEKHYEAEIEKNLATLSLYLKEPAAIADHTGLLDDMKGLTSKLAEASDSLGALKTYFHKEEQDEI